MINNAVTVTVIFIAASVITVTGTRVVLDAKTIGITDEAVTVTQLEAADAYQDDTDAQLNSSAAVVPQALLSIDKPLLKPASSLHTKPLDAKSCIEGQHGSKMGCRISSCPCSWHQQCYTKYYIFDSKASAESLRDKETLHKAPDGQPAYTEVDAGVCALAMPVIVLLCILIFISSLSCVVIVRLCLQWKDQEQERPPDMPGKINLSVGSKALALSSANGGRGSGVGASGNPPGAVAGRGSAVSKAGPASSQPSASPSTPRRQEEETLNKMRQELDAKKEVAREVNLAAASASLPAPGQGPLIADSANDSGNEADAADAGAGGSSK